MSKPQLFVLFFFSIAVGCTSNKMNQPVQVPKNNFDYFEMSYESGGIGQLQFCVDSNAVFLANGDGEPVPGSIKFGKLPDSLLMLVDSFAAGIHVNTRKGELTCMDCSLMSALSVKGKDTLRYFKEGYDSTVIDLCEKLEVFVDSNQHRSVRGMMFLETTADVAPPPPPPPPRIRRHE